MGLAAKKRFTKYVLSLNFAWYVLACFPSGHNAMLMCVSGLQNPVPNAYTLAIGGRKPFIVVHTALLELLEPGEVQVHCTPPPPPHPLLVLPSFCLLL